MSPRWEENPNWRRIPHSPTRLEIEPKGPGKRGHIVADTLLPTKMFPRLPACATQKMFLILFRNILCPQQMFPSLRSPRNIMGNNVSSFTRAFRPFLFSYLAHWLAMEAQTSDPWDVYRILEKGLRDIYVCIHNWPLPTEAFQGQCKQTMINRYSNKHNHVKNPNWREAYQLAINKRSREVELVATENSIS